MQFSVKSAFLAVAVTTALTVTASADQNASRAGDKPTIVLLHGAFADSSGWAGVINRLTKDGYRVIAAPNPLRSVAGDAAGVGSLLSTIQGPVVLVGHSYGGTVITQAAGGHANVKALVYVSAFEPDVDENSLGLTAHDPGATLGQALSAPVALGDGSHDMYIDVKKFRAQFAPDVPKAQAALMAVTQRPVRDAALAENVTAAAWKTIPSWSIYGDADLNIPPATMAFMSKRAHSRHTVVIHGASHVPMISHPGPVAQLIEEAATQAGH